MLYEFLSCYNDWISLLEMIILLVLVSLVRWLDLSLSLLPYTNRIMLLTSRLMTSIILVELIINLFWLMSIPTSCYNVQSWGRPLGVAYVPLLSGMFRRFLLDMSNGLSLDVSDVASLLRDLVRNSSPRIDIRGEREVVRSIPGAASMLTSWVAPLV